MGTRSIVITVLAGVSAVAVPAAAMEVARPPRPRVVKAVAAKPAAAPPAVAKAPAAEAKPAPTVDTTAPPVTVPKPPEPPVTVAKPAALPVPKVEPAPMRLACEAGLPDGRPAVRCKWSALDGARQYVLYRKTGDAAPERIYSGPDTGFVDHTVAVGKGYAYGVKAIDGAGRIIGAGGPVGVRCCGDPLPEKQTLRMACESGLPDGVPTVRCQWSPAEGAAHYDLYRKTPDGRVDRIYSGPETGFVDHGVAVGMAYGYGVKAIDGAGRIIGMGGFVTVKCCGDAPAPDPQTLRMACEAGVREGVPAVRCEWSPADGAVRYDLYRKTTDGTKEQVWSGTDTSFVDHAVTEGMAYGYVVKAVDGAGRIIAYGGVVEVRCCGGVG